MCIHARLFARVVPAALSCVIAIMLVGCVEGILPSGGGGLSASAARTVTTAQTDGEKAARVTLDGSGSRKGDDEIVEYQWFLSGEIVASGAKAEVLLSAGVFEIVLRVTDASGAIDTDTVFITVSGPARTTFDLVTGISGGEGELTPALGISSHEAGSRIIVRAIPDAGFAFLRWSGDLNTDEPSTTLLMDRDRFITAEFTPIMAGDLPRFFAPWAPGQPRSISQGNNGPLTHQDRFAWDIPMPIGTAVLAVGAGRVVRVVENNPRNDPEQPEISGKSNFLIVDHGHGLISRYDHLDLHGVIVEPGQLVARGQVLALSCNTGLSTGPHLHYEVFDTNDRSIATGFFEAPRPGGVAQQGDVFVSRNELSVESVDGYVQSTLPLDAFSINDIVLFEESLPAFFLETQTDYTLRGQVLDERKVICLALVEPQTGDTVFCDLTEVDDEGRFEFTFSFDPELIGTFFMGMISGDDGAEGVLGHQVFISSPGKTSSLPVAMIDQPDPVVVRFNQTRSLIGRADFPPTGRRLTFRWVQVAGPIALIDDPTDSQTTFRIEPSEGTERVTFQLTASDGISHTLPAQVDFFMTESFLVTEIGVMDFACTSEDQCLEHQPAPLVLSTGTIAAFVEVINIEEGDSAVFKIINPQGKTIRATLLPEFTEFSARSFLRFAWSTDGIEPLEGTWVGLFEHNANGVAQVEFTFTP